MIISATLKMAKKLGIKSPLQPVPSIGLGTNDVSLWELTASYAPFINGGYKIEPILVTKITDRKGKVLAKFKQKKILEKCTNSDCIIAIFMNQDESKSEFASFHIRQALGVFLTFFLLGYPIGYFDSWMITSSFWVFVFILWIYGFLGALSGEKRIVPLVGEFYQNMFKNL